MTRKSIWAAIVLLALHTPLRSQTVTLDSYANQLLFNVFKEPAPEIREFLKLYIPSLLDKKNDQPAAGKQRFESHGFIFMEHPFFKSAFANGKVEFDCRRYVDTKELRVDNVRLWLNFDTQQEAETAFGQIVQTLKPVCPKNRVYTENGSLNAELIDTKSASGFNRLQLFLATDYTDRSKFGLLVVPGRM